MPHYDPRALAYAFPRFATWKLLGQGGEGAVFKVWDRFRKNDVALKLMRDTGGDPELGHRFEREYAILATSRSDRLVRVFEHGHEVLLLDDGEHGHYWYTMEICETSVRRIYPSMPLARRVEVVFQMLDGLAFLHAKDIAHRDIKPDNIFIAGGQIKLGDFGLARTEQAAQAGAPERLGQLFGSPPYLAPERWTEKQDADWRPSDQYAAGITAFEILSAGRAPLDFGDQSPAAFFHAHARGRVYPLHVPEVNRALPAVDYVMSRMLGKHPGWRYADLAECKRELSAALSQDNVT